MPSHGPVATPEDVDKALTVLAYYGGNSGRASRETGIESSLLRKWRLYTHRDRYLEIAEREAARIEAHAAAQARELIVRSADIEHTILDRLSGQDEAEPTTKELAELAGALQRVTTSKGINTTKLLELTGRPTQIVEHRDPKQAAEALARRLSVVLSTAEDITSEQRALNTASHETNARGVAGSSAAD